MRTYAQNLCTTRVIDFIGKQHSDHSLGDLLNAYFGGYGANTRLAYGGFVMNIRGLIDYFKVGHPLFLIPVCFFAVYDSVFSAFSTIVAQLTAAYPDVPVVVIQTAITIPSAVAVPASLLSGVLTHTWGAKRISEISLVLMFIGGMLPVALSGVSIYVVYASSILIGIGQGFLHPLANTVICLVWGEEDKRARVLGFKQAANYIGAVLISIAVGYLAVYSWTQAYWVYILLVPIFIVTHMTLPGIDKNQSVKEKLNLSGYKELVKPSTIYLYVMFLVAMMFMFVFRTHIARLVQAHALGAVTDPATLSAVTSIASCILGMLYGKVSGKLGRYAFASGLFVLAIGMIIIALAPNFTVCLVGTFIFGMGTGMQEINSVFYISKTVKRRSTAIALSVLIAVVQGGAFLSPIALTNLETFLFGGHNPETSFIIAGIGFALLGTIEIVRCIRRRNMHEEVIEDDDDFDDTAFLGNGD